MDRNYDWFTRYSANTGDKGNRRRFEPLKIGTLLFHPRTLKSGTIVVLGFQCCNTELAFHDDLMRINCLYSRLLRDQRVLSCQIQLRSKSSSSSSSIPCLLEENPKFPFEAFSGEGVSGPSEKCLLAAMTMVARFLVSGSKI
jgi:hypothetical protein